jgi:hypothetical protein
MVVLSARNTNREEPKMFDHLEPTVTRRDAIQSVAKASGLSLPEASARFTALASDLGYRAPFTPRQVEAMADLITEESN